MSKGFDRPLQHHEYIKLKYLTGTCDQLEEKAKKRKLIKAATKCKKIRIYDDDIDLKKLQPNRADSDDEEIHYGTKEDRPVIAAIIDERPKSRKAQGKWVSVETPDLSRVKVEREDGDDGDVNKTQDLQLTSDQNSAKSSSPRRGRRSRWEEPDDLSPPRRATSQPSNTDTNDLSPPRQRNTSTRDDLSPPRNSNSREADLSPPRARHSGSNKDLSPPRRRREDKRDHRDRYRSNHSTKHEVVIKKEKESPERGRERKSSERHRDTRHEQRTSSDLSPPRKSHRGSRSERIDSNRVIDSRPTKSSHRDSDSHRSSKRSEDTHVSSRHHTDSHRSDSDKGRPMVSADKEQNEVVTEKRHGLSSAKAIKEEEMRLRAKEKEAFSKIDATLLGKGAKTVHRDSKTGKIRDMDAEAKESAEKREAEDAKYAKYKDWNVGLKQREEQKQNLEDVLYEMSKPLARYEDDADLDKLLREKEQADDPMLAYFRKKKRKEKIKEAKEKGVPVEPEKPRYKGPTAAPLNRFNIEPGYRWDGVDRSNGFEKSYFEKIAEKTAIQEEAYRWSTEDM